MDVAVDEEDRLKVLYQAMEGDKADVGGILGVSKAEGWRVGDQDVQLAPVAHALEAGAKLKTERTPAHLGLRELIGAGFIAKAPAKSRDAHPTYFHDPAVDVLASLRAGHL
jgi:hypothetical protein